MLAMIGPHVGVPVTDQSHQFRTDFEAKLIRELKNLKKDLARVTEDDRQARFVISSSCFKGVV
jgi:hypothetical protein